MACGTPVVSVNVGDVKELLAGVDDCYITTYDPNEIATKIQQAIAFKSKTNGPKCIIDKGLSNEIVVNNILDIYQKLVTI